MLEQDIVFSALIVRHCRHWSNVIQINQQGKHLQAAQQSIPNISSIICNSTTKLGFLSKINPLTIKNEI